LGFGVLPPTISHEDALLVPVSEANLREALTLSLQNQKGDRSDAAPLIVPVPASVGDEQSIADGDITIDSDGNMTAQVTIHMGVARSAQIRGTLNGIEPGERQHFLEQVARRIFPGTMSAEGEIRNENDPERAVELQFSCRAPRLLSFNGHTAELDQLAPALGLRQMYGLGPRQFPLYIDAPLIETATFRVHLPAGLRVVQRAADLRLHNELGEYSVEFRYPTESEIDIRRAFRIPVEVVAPDRFEEFASFARQIDAAEQQRITLARKQ
jgi:hypothetical protein